MDREDEYLFLSGDLPAKRSAFFEHKRREFCDIRIQIGERTVPAHRIILSAAIPYFYRMFSSEDEKDYQENVMTLADVDPDSLELLIDFAYTSSVAINTGNVKALLSAACFLQVDEVRDACCRFLLARLNLQNVLSIREHSFKLNCTELKEKADSYIRANFEEISETPDFLNIPFDMLVELSERDDLKLQSEEKLFEAIMKWVKHCTEERGANLPDLLRNVRLGHIKPTYIKNHIQREELIRKSMECRDILEKFMYDHFIPEETDFVQKIPYKSRSHIAGNSETTPNKTAYICVIQHKVKRNVDCWDLAKRKWKRNVYHNTFSDFRDTVAGLKEKLYCFDPTITCAYDIEREEFCFHKRMTLPRCYAGSAVHGNKIYVLGGRAFLADGQPPSNAVECFDPVPDEWTTLESMKMCRGAPGVVSSDEFIYVLGGRDTDRCVLNTAEKFHVSTGVWKVMPPMLTNRCALGCAMLNEKVYVCGGRSDDITATAEVFDTITNEWKQIASLNTARELCKLVSWQGNLCALAGANTDGIVNSLEVYEPEEDKWYCESAMDLQIPVDKMSLVYLHSF